MDRNIRTAGNINFYVFKLSCLKYFFFLMFVCIHYSHPLAQQTGNKGAPTIWVLSGGRAELPCPKKPRITGDSTLLVLWYKGSLNTTAYSYDARGSRFSAGNRWSNRTLFGERAYFVPLNDPPALVLDPVIARDQGKYICKVDYQNSPTTISIIRLKVIIPPSNPEVYWDGHLTAGAVGPLDENTSHRLTCISQGGHPSPTLVWWMGSRKILSELEEHPDNSEVRSHLTINATRNVNLKILSCHVQLRAGSVIAFHPLIASVYLNVTLPPLGVSLDGGESLIVAGEMITLTCSSWGSNPPAAIEWWRAGRKVKNFSLSIAENGNLSRSEITVMANASDHGVSFTCTASNSLLSSAPLVASRRLDVLYKPNLKLQVKLSNKSGIKSVRETRPGLILKRGQNIRLHCSADANPIPEYVEWLKDDIRIDAGFNQWSLYLDNVGNEHSGSYSCAASNNAGLGISNEQKITVEYKPKCAKGWIERMVGAQIGRPLSIICRVEALPSKDIQFTWYKITNHSKIKIKPEYLQVDGLTSRLTIRPESFKDFGVFLCNSENVLGHQDQPCKINVIQARQPDPPFNCSTVADPSLGSLFVRCSEGFDGGSSQKFVLIADQNGKFKANITRSFPEWLIANLEDDSDATIRIFAFNDFGRSDIKEIRTIVPPRQVAAQERSFESNFPLSHETTMQLFSAILGTGLIIIIVTTATLCFTCFSRRKKLPNPKSYSTNSLPSQSPSQWRSGSLINYSDRGLGVGGASVMSTSEDGISMKIFDEEPIRMQQVVSTDMYSMTNMTGEYQFPRVPTPSSLGMEHKPRGGSDLHLHHRSYESRPPSECASVSGNYLRSNTDRSLICSSEELESLLISNSLMDPSKASHKSLNEGSICCNMCHSETDSQHRNQPHGRRVNRNKFPYIKDIQNSLVRYSSDNSVGKYPNNSSKKYSPFVQSYLSQNNIEGRNQYINRHIVPYMKANLQEKDIKKKSRYSGRHLLKRPNEYIYQELQLSDYNSSIRRKKYMNQCIDGCGFCSRSENSDSTNENEPFQNITPLNRDFTRNSIHNYDELIDLRKLRQLTENKEKEIQISDIKREQETLDKSLSEVAKIEGTTRLSDDLKCKEKPNYIPKYEENPKLDFNFDKSSSSIEQSENSCTESNISNDTLEHKVHDTEKDIQITDKNVHNQKPQRQNLNSCEESALNKLDEESKDNLTSSCSQLNLNVLEHSSKRELIATDVFCKELSLQETSHDKHVQASSCKPLKSILKHK